MLALASSFGQTYFIALYSTEIRTTLAISHGEFGGLYMIATLASAAVMVWLGKTADTWHFTKLCLLTVVGLAAMALVMAGVSSAAMLVVALFGLRLLGQGMLSHLPQTAMSRWFNARRGQALALASLGHPAGEVVLPIAAVTATFYLGWRQSWILISVVLVVLVLPAVHWLLKVDRTPMSAQAPGEHGTAEPGQRQWTVAEMIRGRMFYLLLPGVIAPAFAITGVFFHQAHLATVKGWSLAWIAANYPVYAVFTVGAAIGAGWAVDRWNAKRLLVFYQPSLVAGLVIMALWDTTLAVPVFMAAAGITAGAGNTIVSALWAEIYGVRHLGAIRSLLFAGAVAASALAPGLMGWGIDEGIGIESQFIAIAAYILAGIGLFFVARRQLSGYTSGISD